MSRRKKCRDPGDLSLFQCCRGEFVGPSGVGLVLQPFVWLKPRHVLRVGIEGRLDIIQNEPLGQIYVKSPE